MNISLQSDIRSGAMTRLGRNERLYAIVKYLASTAGGCATLDDLLEALKPLHEKTKAKDIKNQVFITLYRLRKHGLLKRTWVDVNGKRKKIYCLSLEA